MTTTNISEYGLLYLVDLMRIGSGLDSLGF